MAKEFLKVKLCNVCMYVGCGFIIYDNRKSQK